MKASRLVRTRTARLTLAAATTIAAIGASGLGVDAAGPGRGSVVRVTSGANDGARLVTSRGGRGQ